MEDFLASLENVSNLFSDDEELEGIDFDIIDKAPTGRHFGTVTLQDVDHFLENQENNNTRRKTTSDVELFKTYLRGQNEHRNVEIIPPVELNTYISSYFIAVKKKNGEEYEPTTIRSFFSSIDRFLKKNHYPFHILTDFQFDRCRQILRAKQKQLKSMGKGNKPCAADPLTDEEIGQMYEAKVLGPHNACSLLHSLWLINSIHFGIRTGQEAHSLKWGDIQLQEEIDENENESYLVYTQERQTKTRTGLNPRDVRKTKPRAYSIPDQPDRDPVKLYKLYRERRPVGYLDPETPFYLAINTMGGINPEQVWYKKSPMGLNRIYDIMNRLKAGSYMENKTGKRLTGYSARKHLVQKLWDKGIPPNQIIQISGHKNLNSLNNYGKLNQDQSRNISHILSNSESAQTSSCLPSRPSPTATFTSQSLPETAPTNPSFPPGIFVGNQIHGNIHVHIHQTPQMPPVSSTTTTQTSSQYQVILPLVSDISAGMQCSFPQTTGPVQPASQSTVLLPPNTDVE